MFYLFLYTEQYGYLNRQHACLTKNQLVKFDNYRAIDIDGEK